ncbi:MAG: TetR/AcrR family transcriptional regulator [Actinobacteria bacterium]|nr:TetR/AcrR family transcriptional regulator [Actinomycetota bacterium]
MNQVKRQYRQTARADHVAATRRRIVEAAVALHSTVGPANTTLSAVAREAGVSRPTLYAHFPDEATLFRACTMHSMAQSPPPDPRAWSTIDEPRDRVRTGLTELYTHYARNDQMLENVFRDMYVVESMREFNVPLVEASFEQMTEVLTSCFGDAPTSARRRAALVALALSFDTWQILARDRALTDDEAAELMTTVVVTSVA